MHIKERRRGGGEGGIWRSLREEERKADYGAMVQSSQQHVAPCVKVVEWGFGTRGLGILAAFWAGIPKGFIVRTMNNSWTLLLWVVESDQT